MKAPFGFCPLCESATISLEGDVAKCPKGHEYKRTEIDWPEDTRPSGSSWRDAKSPKEIPSPKAQRPLAPPSILDKPPGTEPMVTFPEGAVDFVKPQKFIDGDYITGLRAELEAHKAALTRMRQFEVELGELLDETRKLLELS